MGGPRSPFPNIRVHPNSGLTFPWMEWNPQKIVGSFDASLGQDGVNLAMLMMINWADLNIACQQLLGYTKRDNVNFQPSRLVRKLPWIHPYWNQLVVKNISKVQGIKPDGTSEQNAGDDVFNPSEGGQGTGSIRNTGPWQEFQYAALTIHFWRPPYFVRSDADILDNTQNPPKPQEWLRYFDKHWGVQVQMLSRESSQFVFVNGQGLDGKLFPGTVGQPIMHLPLTRTWYEIPEQAIFSTVTDQTPNGLPTNLVLTQTKTNNPMTNYVYPVSSPICGCVNIPIGGGQILANGPPFIGDQDGTKRFLGIPMGVLLYKGPEFIERPLQLPPYLMEIGVFSGNEPFAQLQYDVRMHFDYFDPPRGSTVPASYRGHNLEPYSGDGLWYAVQGQLGISGGPSTTPFQYADMSDLFQIL